MATISSLDTGATILLKEADGSYADYTLVQLDYNDGKALLWRNESIGSSAWRATNVAASSMLYQGSDLDTYLTTWYQNLPSDTQNVLSSISYPVASTNSSSGPQTYISRYAATVSGSEIGCTNSSGGYYGTELDFYYKPAATSYWTRQPYAGLAAVFYYNKDDAVFSGVSSTSSRGVRPTVGVDQESIEVTWDGTLGGYKLSKVVTATPCTAPAALYLDGGSYNYGDVEPGNSYTLSWDAGTGSSIIGYAVYYSTSSSGSYTWMKDVTGTSTTVYAPDTYSTYRYFKVKTLGADSSLDSELSTAYRYVHTKDAPTQTTCTAPSTLYLNGYASNQSGATPGSSFTLSWSAGTGSSISGYKVWSYINTDDSFTLCGTTAATVQSMTVYAADTYSTTKNFYVQTICSDGTSSSYSSPRSITTKTAESTGTQCTAPSTLYLDGGTYNYGACTPGKSYTLSWDAGTGTSITGYGVYYSTSENGTYTWMKDVTGTSTTVYAPDTYSTYRYFKVKTLGSDSSLDSALSTSYRSVWTAADPDDICTAPSTLYLNGTAADITSAAPDATYTLSWSSGTGSSISGYAVYYKDTGDSYYNYLGQTTSQSMTVSAPSDYSTTRSFCVSTLSSILGASSDYSSVRSITTKAESSGATVPYYNGSAWVDATPWYYNGSTWVEVIDVIYYPSYRVVSAGAAYGFALNSDGYWESQNSGDSYHGTYALCKVRIFADGVSNVYVDYITGGEGSTTYYDYGLLSKIDTTLSSSDTSSSTNVHGSFVISPSSSVRTIDYGVLTAGEHYIYAKYTKDGSVSNTPDSLQFKVRFE